MFFYCFIQKIYCPTQQLTKLMRALCRNNSKIYAIVMMLSSSQFRSFVCLLAPLLLLFRSRAKGGKKRRDVTYIYMYMYMYVWTTLVFPIEQFPVLKCPSKDNTVDLRFKIITFFLIVNGMDKTKRLHIIVWFALLGVGIWRQTLVLRRNVLSKG